MHEKLLHSDWLRAVQFKCNISAKLHIVILDYDRLKDDRKISKPMISRKILT